MQKETVCLIRQAQQGDTQAFDVLVHRFQDRAVGYARSILHDSAAADDAAQEAFVQAWRDIAQLREPDAFPVWLRRIVFKHCDRTRRSQHLTLVSFDNAFHIAGGAEPAVFLETSQDALQVRDALDALPEREREAALLYYLGERDLAEIAAFLGVPRTTIKNRLHAARKRLRKELWEMAEEILEKEKPSKDEAFAENVLARILAEFNRQMRADPRTADRSLLRDGREKLDAALSEPWPLDRETVSAGFHILYKQDDLKALAQPLDDSHTVWVYFHLANSLACSGDVSGAVLAHEAFENWLPGKKPRLARNWPYSAPAESTAEPCYEGEKDILLFTLGKSMEFARAWRSVWREDEYLAKVDAALGSADVKPNNQWPRFACLRMAATICETSGKFARSRGYVNKMYEIAAEPPGGEDAPESWRARAIGHDIQLRRSQHDEEGATQKTEEMAELVASAEESGGPEWARGQRHDLGCKYILLGYYDRALPLFELNAARGGQANAWGYLMHGAAVWKVTGDRDRTIYLLRMASAYKNRDMTALFLNQSAFAEVKEDAEFLKAVQNPE
ncbi:MAG: sigma-70 family RNA polymerase sigma factor [Armatimonadota bacterium]